MRIAFCGSGTFAVPSLRALLNGPHEVVRILTQPARPAGRGGKLRPTSVALAAGEAGCEAAECADINAGQVVADLQSLRPDVICVVDFGQMIRKPVRDAAEIDTINLHGSILPALRGAAPVNWAIIRGEEQTGVTTFSLVDEMDAGPVYLTAQTDISPQETANELSERLAQIGAGVLCRTLELLAGGAQAQQQDHSKATSAPRLKKSDGVIDWTADAVSVRNRIHGAWSWPGGRAVFCRGDGRQTPVTIARASVETGEALREPGMIDGDLCVATGGGRIRILQLTPAGKRLMDWRDFVNGYRVAEGDCMRKVGT